MSFDQSYYANRALEEREMATATTDRRAAQVHRDMASRYAALARGEDVSDDASLTKLGKRLRLTGDRAMRLIRTDAEHIVGSNEAIVKSQNVLRTADKILARHRIP